MSFLLPTRIEGTVRWLGQVRKRANSLASTYAATLEMNFDGIEGEHHAGATRLSCTRVKRQYAVGTEIRNTRQVSLVSVEELDAIARKMDLPEVRPEWLGANVLLEGIPELTRVPPASRLIFDGGASLVVDTENTPCRHPAELLESMFPGQGLAFPSKARGLRGIVAWVERPGRVHVGEQVRLHVPHQKTYSHLEKAPGDAA